MGEGSLTISKLDIVMVLLTAFEQSAELHLIGR
jgi:hypothetical protein